MTDLAPLAYDELRERYGALYRQVQQAGCPRDVVLAFDAVSDELDRRDRDRPQHIVCVLGDDDRSLDEYDDQPPGPEWGA